MVSTCEHRHAAELARSEGRGHGFADGLAPPHLAFYVLLDDSDQRCADMMA